MVSCLRKIGNRGRAALAVAAMTFLAACEPGAMAPVTNPFGTAGQTVDVALLVPSGSGVGELDVIARSLENAARLAVADLDGVEVNLTVYSTQRNAGVAVAAATQAIADGADILLGPLDGDVAAAVGLAVQGRGTNVLAFSNNTAIAGGNVFLLGQTFEDSANRVAQYARAQGRSRVVVVHAETVAGTAGRDAATRAISRSGMTLAGTTGFENSLTGVSSAVGEVRASVAANSADTVFLTSTSSGALPIIAELLPEAGVDPATTQYLGLSRWDADPRLFSIGGIQGGWFAMPDRARQSAFTNRYASTYGGPPHALAFTAYDGIAIIGALWAQGGTSPLSAQALTRGNGFQGAMGIVRLLPDGTNQRGLAIGSIQNGQVMTLQAAPRGFGGGGL